MSANEGSGASPPTENPTPAHVEESHIGQPFPVVGIGASAGGLEAFTELLEALPGDAGIAVIFVSHLDPNRKSHLPELLGKVSRMPVHEVAEGMVVEVNNVYVIPPATNMALTDGHLTLTPRSTAPGVHMPIDHLLRSLATIQKSKAIGVILSGNGTDGALALQAIKAEGGITFAQDEKSAKYDGMPRAAIQDGNIDYILRPRDIAAQLERIARHPYAQESAPAREPAPPTDGDPVAQIISLMRTRTAVDFTNYKQSTIQRRIFRRMALRNLENPLDYLQLLREDTGELNSLYQDFLIRVTQFFRDADAFEALKDKVFPHLVKGRTAAMPLRIWVAGCSTGEEVYSLAIALLEYLDNRPENVVIKILATDLNETALEKARVGIYVDNIEIDVSPERLRRFFVHLEGSYQISKAVRELCIFSRHNLTSDPPFSRLDLISCRNVLIYMDNALQKRVLPLFHYALNPGGYLFLGSSENVGSYIEMFTVADARYRIFAKNAVASGVGVDFASVVAPELHFRPHVREGIGALWSALDVQKEADRILLSRYAPVGVVVDESMTVIQFRGRTADFLEPAPGMATLDLFRMLREGLLAEVRAAVIHAKNENAPTVRESLRLASPNNPRQVRVEVVPFRVAPSGVRFFLVLFQDTAPAVPPAAPAPAPPAPSATEQQVGQLQQEITALRDYLQSVIEEQESTNEELKSANEEILSANEELQSTNEELQTAKEEAQSANEELATVNEELRHRNIELARVNNDLLNLLAGVSIPIVMVGRDLRVRRFTPLSEKLFNLIPTDVGRPIGDIKPNLRVDDLPRLITGVIDTLTPHESEMQDNEGRWYLLRIRPYVTLDNKIDGASIVLLDIDVIKRELERVRAARGASQP